MVAAKEPGFSYDTALFVALTRPAEARLKAPVRAERDKARRLFPLMTAQDFLHC